MHFTLSASNPILSSHFAKVGLRTESELPYWGVAGGRVNEQTLHHSWTNLGTLSPGIKQLPRAQTLWAVSRVLGANGPPELESPAKKFMFYLARITNRVLEYL